MARFQKFIIVHEFDGETMYHGPFNGKAIAKRAAKALAHDLALDEADSEDPMAWVRTLAAEFAESMEVVPLFSTKESN